MPSFGSFDSFCSQVSLTVCPLVGAQQDPICYSRNVEIIPSYLIFQPATLVIEFIALIMTLIMISHIRSKYTAVGRKEIVIFFYLYIATTIVELLLITGWVAVASSAYPWIVAAHIGLITASCWSLLLNGFVGFQWSEDGTATSVWTIRISAFIAFCVAFFISIATFMNIFGFNSQQPIILFIVYFVLNGLFLLIYFICQVILVTNTLDDRWPLGDILFALTFFVIGQLFDLVFSVQVCKYAQHYIDGLFFGTICSLLGVMMVYKYWDSITKEDLEFSVTSKANVWELPDEKEPMLK